jgi:hypothetical protein
MPSVRIRPRTARTFVLSTVFTLVVPLGLISVVGCGDSAPEDKGTVKSDSRPQEGIDTMKKFMEQQKGASKK